METGIGRSYGAGGMDPAKRRSGISSSPLRVASGGGTDAEPVERALAMDQRVAADTRRTGENNVSHKKFHCRWNNNMASAGVGQWSGCTERAYSSNGPLVRERRLRKPSRLYSFTGIYWPLFGFYQRSSAANKTLSLHTDPVALGASPLALLVVDVSLQFLHLNSACFAGHRLQDRRSFAGHGTAPQRVGCILLVYNCGLTLCPVKVSCECWFA